RTCENTVYANRSRPCLLYQIERCTAPCVGYISEEEYGRDVGHASMFLQGREQQVMDELSEKMMEAAGNQSYEMASIYRDRMQSLRQVQARQFVSDFSVSDADVIACAELQGQYCVNLVMIRGGRQLGDKCFFPKNADAEDMEIILEAFVEQHYVS